MSTNRGAHLVELAHVFAGTPIASEWAKKAAVTRRQRSAQQKLPLTAATTEPNADQHIDVCQRCSDPRFDLCPTGAKLLDGARVTAEERVWCAWRGRITFLEQDAAWRLRVASALSRRGRACDPNQLEPRRRVTKSLVANESAPFPAALCYHGWRPERFARHFGALGEMYSAPVAATRRPRGRPKATLPPAITVLAHLTEGKSIRGVAAAMGVPKNRIESVRKLQLFRTLCPNARES